MVAVISGAKNGASSAGKDVAARIDSKRQDITICQAGVPFHPVSPIIGGAKDTSANNPGKDAPTRIDGQRTNSGISQAGVDLGPVCAIVSGAKDAARSPGKNVPA